MAILAEGTMDLSVIDADKIEDRNGYKTVSVDSAGLIMTDGENEVFKVVSVEAGTELVRILPGPTVRIPENYEVLTKVTALSNKGNIEEGMYAVVNARKGYVYEGKWFYPNGQESPYTWRASTPSDGIWRFNSGFTIASEYLVEGESVKENVIEFEGAEIHPTIIRTFEYLDGITVNSGAQGSGSFDVSLPSSEKGKYTPVGIVGYSVDNEGGSGCSYATFSKLTVSKGSYEENSNHGTVEWRMRAVAGKVTSCALRLQILWQRL